MKIYITAAIFFIGSNSIKWFYHKVGTGTGGAEKSLDDVSGLEMRWATRSLLRGHPTSLAFLLVVCSVVSFRPSAPISHYF